MEAIVAHSYSAYGITAELNKYLEIQTVNMKEHTSAKDRLSHMIRALPLWACYAGKINLLRRMTTVSTVSIALPAGCTIFTLDTKAELEVSSIHL